MILAETTGVAAACDALDVPRSAIYRRRRPRPPRESKPRPRPPRALPEAQQARVLEHMHSEAFVDKAPRTIWAELLDLGVYLCSPRTMYRLLEEHDEVRERRDQRRHPQYKRPELMATAPNQVWTWDISLVRGPVKGVYYRLYVLMDMYSRYVVGWMLAEREDTELAKQLLAETFAKQGSPDDLTIHADNGPAPASDGVSKLLRRLGVAESHSRPHVSDDNPFSEALFKTVKYRPDYPDRFDSIGAARAHFRAFFDWYNNHHRHIGIALLTPFAVHHGLVEQHQAARQEVLDRAYREHPERFVHRPPTPPSLPEAVYINPPKTQTLTH
jgi:putative transposase